MRKSVIYLMMGAVTIAVIVTAGALVVHYKSEPQPENLAALYRDSAKYDVLTIRYPLDETLFPPEIVPPEFQWEDGSSRANMWLLSIKFQDGNTSMNI